MDLISKEITHDTKGVALLVSNGYDGKDTLHGTYKDAQKMTSFLIKWKYAVIWYHNVDREFFITFCKTLAQYKYPEICRRLLVGFFGHGDDGVLIFQDGKHVSISELMNLFKPNNAKNKTLGNMVRMFIIDACRSNQKDFGWSRSRGAASTIKQDIDKEYPNDGNMLVAYSTTRHHVSFEKITGGTWTTYLLEELEREPHKNLLDILVKVNGRLKNTTFQGKYHQIGEFTATLSENVYFKEEAALEQGKSALEQEKAALEQGKSALEQEKAALEQGKAALKQGKAALEQQKAALKQEKTTLEQEKAALEQQEVALEQGEAALEQREAALEQGGGYKYGKKILNGGTLIGSIAASKCSEEIAKRIVKQGVKTVAAQTTKAVATQATKAVAKQAVVQTAKVAAPIGLAIEGAVWGYKITSAHNKEKHGDITKEEFHDIIVEQTATSGGGAAGGIGGAVAGATAGAVVGSVVPIVGTAIGGAIGGFIGGIFGGLGGSLAGKGAGKVINYARH